MAKDQPQCVLGVPKTTLCRFGDSQRISGTWQAVKFVVTIYYSEMRKSKISKGERCTGSSPGETRCKLAMDGMGRELHCPAYVLSVR